jgi:hypothetical protein
MLLEIPTKMFTCFQEENDKSRRPTVGNTNIDTQVLQQEEGKEEGWGVCVVQRKRGKLTRTLS